MDNLTDEIEIDLAELLYYLKTKIGWIILAFLGGGIVAGLVTCFIVTPMYTAVSKVYMVSPSSESVLNLSDLNLGTSLSQDYEELIRIRPVFNGVIEELELDCEYEDLLGQVKIEPVGNTRLLKISVEDSEPQRAQMIANALADAAVTYIPKLMNTTEPNIAEYAIMPKKPSSPSIVRNSLASAVACVGVMVAFYVFVYMKDDTVKSSDDLERYFGLIPLTVIPEGKIDAISDETENKKKKRKHRYKKKKRKKKHRKNGEVWDLN